MSCTGSAPVRASQTLGAVPSGLVESIVTAPSPGHHTDDALKLAREVCALPVGFGALPLEVRAVVPFWGATSDLTEVIALQGRRLSW